MIYALVGASGAGKTTLLRNIMRALPEAQPLMSVTTRDRRPSDIDGEYEYVSEEAFDALNAAGAFLWTAGARGKHYATRKANVEEGLQSGLYFPILVPSVLKTLYEFAFLARKQKELKFIYLRVEDEAELRRRLGERGDDSLSIERSIRESRLWNEEAQTLGIRFFVLDASQSPEAIAKAALDYIQSNLPQH